MGEGNKKAIKARTYEEFVNEVADDCYADLTEEQKEIIRDNPIALDYHFGYCMYIRNNYIYNNVENLDFEVEPDELSGTIMNVLIRKITGDNPGDIFQYRLNSHKEYCKLRKLYRKKYGKDARILTEKYRGKYPDEKNSILDFLYQSLGIPAYIPEKYNYTDLDDRLQKLENRSEYDEEVERKEKVVNELIAELAELVWKADTIRSLADSYGIDAGLVEERIEKVKAIFAADKAYIPMGTCLLPYRSQIGEELYGKYRDELIVELEEDPHLMEKLDLKLFHDRELARVVLKHPFAMQLLEEYQNDDEMVRYSLEYDGGAIQYVNERYVCDRDWVRFAIEHSENLLIMDLDCMERYRSDKEFVYLACRVSPGNITVVNEIFRDDFDLAYLAMSSANYKSGITRYLSDRLKDNISLAVLESDKDFFFFALERDYSKKVLDSEEVAEAIIKHHGVNSFEMYLMSDRIKEKYGFDKNA